MSRPLLATIALVVLAACGEERTPTPRPLVCSTLSTGCSCGTRIVGDGTEICDTTSVIKEAGQQGYCCETDFVCQCFRRECAYVEANRSCQCGNPQGAADGVRMNDCSGPVAAMGLTCCLNSFGCMCGTSPCGDPSEAVAGCSVADVSKCDDAIQRTVTSCK